MYNTPKYYSVGGYGGGILCMNANPDIINTTVILNSTRNRSDLGEGGGLRIRGLPSPLVRNCILWNNEADPGLEDLDFQYPSLTLDLSYCAVGVGFEGLQCPHPEANVTGLPGLEIEGPDFGADSPA